MTIHDFIIESKKAVREYLDSMEDYDCIIEEVEMTKNNDIRLYGLSLRSKDSNTGVNVYLNDLYDQLKDDTDMPSLMEEVIRQCAASLALPAPDVPDISEMDLEALRSRLFVRLLDVRKNTGYMKNKPYIDAGCSLALVAQINCDEKIVSEWTISATNEIVSAFNCGKEEFLTAALENTIEKESPQLIRILDVIHCDLYGSPEPENLLEGGKYDPDSGVALVLTNRSRYQGAAALFYPGTMERIADIAGDAYYALPSSAHEFMIVPKFAAPYPKQLYGMVKEGNTILDSERDFLSDNVYFYDPEHGKLVIAASDCDSEAKTVVKETMNIVA